MGFGKVELGVMAQRNPVRRRVLLGLFGMLAAFLVIMGLLWEQLESRFVFFPTKELTVNPGHAGLAYEDVFFTSEQGNRLHGWFIPGKPGGSGITWLWLHGNGGNISHRVDELAAVHHRLGVDVLIFDYQGYGRSEGKPSEEGTYRDARSALEYLGRRPEASPERVVYFGRSLGTAVAVNLAAERPPLGLVLVSPFSSLKDMAKLSFPFLPLEWLTRNKYDSMALMSRVNRPLLVVHGALDTMVPVSQGLRIYEAANEPKRLQVLPDAGHNDIATSGGEDYWKALEEFIRELIEGSS